MSGLCIICSITGGLRGGFFTYAMALINKTMRSELFKSLISQEIAFFDEKKTGEIMSRLTSDCNKVSDTVSLNINVFLRNLVMFIGTLIFMITISWRLTFVTFITMPLIGFVTKVFGAYYDVSFCLCHPGDSDSWHNVRAFQILDFHTKTYTHFLTSETVGSNSNQNRGCEHRCRTSPWKHSNGSIICLRNRRIRALRRTTEWNSQNWWKKIDRLFRLCGHQWIQHQCCPNFYAVLWGTFSDDW